MTMPPSANRLKPAIVHVLPKTGIGGAEKHALHLLGTLARHPGIELHLVCFECAEWHDRFTALGIPVHVISRQAKLWIDLPRMLKLRKVIRRLNPDLIQSWLFEANLLCAVTRSQSSKLLTSQQSTRSSEQSRLVNLADAWSKRASDLVIAN